MIFYFTGTGNSLFVANRLSVLLHESVVSISEALHTGTSEFSFTVQQGERILFVFPIHSWGPSVLVLQFISRLQLQGYDQQSVYMVGTCGDDCGLTSSLLGEALLARGICLTDSYSVVMPNNYILMAGFDVDAADEAQRKLVEAPLRIRSIAESIMQQKREGLYEKGRFAWAKSRMIYPLFVKFSIKEKAFLSTDACIGCGLCERVCPTRTIHLVHNRPIWGDGCVQCLACIHRCPIHVIEFGNKTIKKGRYHHPELK